MIRLGAQANAAFPVRVHAPEGRFATGWLAVWMLLALVVLVSPAVSAQDLRGLEENFDAAVIVDEAIVGLTEEGPIVRSVDGGAAFHQLRAATPPDRLYALAAAGDVVIAGGSSGLLLRADFAVSPTTWTEVSSGEILGNLRSISANGAGGWLAVGGDGFSGAILRSTDDGQHWSVVAEPPAHPLFDVVWDPVGSQWIAVGGDSFDGAIYRSVDGLTWTASTIPAGTANLLAVAVDGSGNVMAVGEGGSALLSSDGGLTFAPIEGVTVSEDLQAVVADGSGEWILAGQDGVALSVVGGEADFLFEPDPSEEPISVLIVQDGSVFLVGREVIPAPVISPEAGTYEGPVSVTLSAETGFSIYYTTDGSLPTVGSTLYEGPFEVATSLAVRTVAFDPVTERYSPVASAFYLLESAPEPIAPPEISPEAGAYAGSVAVALSAEAGLSIYYTLDGSTPSTGSILYAAPFELTESATVRAVAWDWDAGIYSPVVAATYEIEPLPPVISPGSSESVGPLEVTLAAAPETLVYYTVDGTAPTTDSILYQGPFSVEQNSTVRAVAWANGILSAESSANYTIRPFGPEILPGGGSFVGATSVTLRAEEGTAIYYTLDGTLPTTESFLYASPFEVGQSMNVRAVTWANGEYGPEASALFTIRPHAPQISPSGGDFVGPSTVILSAQEGAQIYYTLDNTVPTTASILYAGAFELDRPTTVRAVAFANGELGPEVTASFVIRPFTPQISPEGGTFVGPTAVALTSTGGAPIYYTLDGSDPRESTVPYTTPITLEESGTIRAVARAHGVFSLETSADFTIRPFAPTISPEGGDFVGPQQVAIEAQEDAQIYYTLDGTVPTTDSALYAAPFELAASATVRAVAWMNGELGPEASVDFTIRPFAPTISPEGGDFVGPEQVSIEAQAGAQIYYTLDGSAPTADSALYAAPFELEASATVRAAAWLNGELGPETNAEFTIRPFAPTISPEGGDFVGAAEIVLSAQEGATLYYTIDGTAPGTESLLYEGPIHLSAPATIRAVAWLNGELGPEASADFVVRPVAPTISPEGGTFVGSVDITLAGPEGAAVYYTLDGTMPTSESLLYQEPFALDASATVNAVAAMHGFLGPVATASFTIEEPEPPLTLTITPGPDGQFVLNLARTSAGVLYQLQTSDDLVSWWNLGEPVAGTGEELEWLVPVDGAGNFFRATTDLRTTAVPEIQVVAGTYGEAITLALSAEAGAEIYYTLDGTQPTTDSLLYAGPFELTESATVNAVALLDDLYSDVTSAAYDLGPAAPEPFELEIAALSDTERQVTLSGSQTDVQYQLQVSTDLLVWTNLQVPQNGSGSSLVWNVPVGDGPQFYRVVAESSGGSAPLHLNILLVPGDLLLLTLSGSDVEADYQLETSTDLKSWTESGDVQQGTGEPLIWEVPVEGTSRFYRVTRQEPVE